MLTKIKLFRSFWFYPLFIIGAALTMMFLLWAVYLIPIEKIRLQAINSSEILESTYEYTPCEYEIPGLYYDIWTDARMVNMVSFLGEKGALQDSLLNPRASYSIFPIISLHISVRNFFLDDAEIHYYPRFWQGWLIFLKPLFVFFDIKGIRVLNLLLQVFGFLSILWIMFHKLGARYCLAFATTMCFFNPMVSWQCLEFATDINIMLLATIWVLLNKNPNDNHMFFIIGAVTILFDWLTYPLITLGIPLVVYVLLHKRSFENQVRCVIKNSFLWGCGYVAMWVSKWGLATLFTDQNVFKEAWDSILYRTMGVPYVNSPRVDNVTIGNAIWVNLSNMFVRDSFYYFLIIIVGLFINYIVHPFKFKKNLESLVFLGIALMPFVWYAVAKQHSVHHPWMSHKELAITIFAVLVAIVHTLEPVKIAKRLQNKRSYK